MVQSSCSKIHAKASASWLFALAVLAAWPPAGAKARAGDDFLLPEQAFMLSARLPDERSVELTFDIAPGYYLYREQFRFEASGAALGAPAVPAGQVKFDQTFQKNVETHRGRLVIKLPVQQADGPMHLSVSYQGCADKGLCYPPQQWQAEVRLRAFGGVASLQPMAAGGGALSTRAAAATTTTASDTAAVANVRPVVRWLSWLGGALLLTAVAGLALRYRSRARTHAESRDVL